MYHIQPSYPYSGENRYSKARYRIGKIEVIGENSLTVPANRALITLGVVTEDKSVSHGQRENSKIMVDVINALVALGIPNDKIETVTYRIESEYDYENGKQVFKGYKITHQILVTIDQITGAGLVIDTAVNSGANTVSTIQFTVDNQEIYYNQSLSKAIENGQSKAVTIAHHLGVTLYQAPSRVEEMPRTIPPIPFAASFLAKTEATPIQPGSVQFLASVKMTYSFSH